MYREAQRIEADPAQVDNIESLMTAAPEVLQTAPDEVENPALWIQSPPAQKQAQLVKDTNRPWPAPLNWFMKARKHLQKLSDGPNKLTTSH